VTNRELAALIACAECDEDAAVHCAACIERQVAAAHAAGAAEATARIVAWLRGVYALNRSAQHFAEAIEDGSWERELAAHVPGWEKAIVTPAPAGGEEEG
jgi:hypothetical protein